MKYNRSKLLRPNIEEQRKRYAQRKKMNELSNNKPTFLFNSKQSHPIIEYIPSEVESTSLTPSFVLEVTWPRIILFYHPSSPRCKEIQPIYVSLARGIKRRSSRMPVEFHAVNCGIHRDICEQGFNVKSVPIIIGFKSGRIDWVEISIPFEDASLDVEHEVEYLANEVRIPLDMVKGAHAEATFAMQPIGGDGQSSDADNKQLPSDQLLVKSASNMHIQFADQVFHDATASFLETLTSSLYGIALGGTLPRDTSKALSEFIDLIRWAYPPESKLHNLAEDIMLDFDNLIKSEVALRKMSSRHVDLENDTKWSIRCCGADAVGGYECGLWSLLHILSIGVAERHTSVVGADERVSVMYAGQVIRTYINKFYAQCRACRNLWIRLYDDSISTVPGGDIDDWRHLAIWIWEIHNEITVRRDQSAGKGYKGLELRMAPSLSLWPTKIECPKCWQSLNDDTGVAMNMDSYDPNEVYEQLKKTYWLSGIHNNRLIVLDRKRGRGLFAKRLRARLTDNKWPMSLLIIHILFIYLIFRVMISNLCGRVCHRERKKRPVETNHNYLNRHTGKPGWNKPSQHSALKSRSHLSLHSSEQAFLINATKVSPYRTRTRH